MVSYASILESYTIPATESADDITSVSTKEKLKTAFSAIALTALGIAAVKWSIDDRNQQKAKRLEAAKIEAENKARLAKEKEEYEKWKQTPEYSEMVKFVCKKYNIEYPNYNSDDLANKLNKSILEDLKKIANAINRDKKLCAELANKYLSEMQKEDPEYYEKHLKEFESDAKAIKAGPAGADLFDRGEFEICAHHLEQCVGTWVCGDYLFSTFCDGINAKYYREIKLGLMSKMRDIGDGDEGLIASNY